jgi:uncharacterized membrane protein
VRINDSIEIAAPQKLVWEYLADPTHYLHFMSGVTRWEPASDRRAGLGARYRMLLRVGAAEVGGLIEFVEWRPETDMAWTSVTGVDQRGRWRIRRIDRRRTRVELRYSYGVAGSGVAGLIAERVAAFSISRQLGRSLQQLKREVEHEQLRAEARERAEATASA